MKILGLEFAPLDIPLHRRLETLSVLIFTNLLVIGPAVTVLLVYLLFTRYYFISLLYFAWWYYDLDSCHNGGWTLQLGRENLVSQYVRDYFPIKLIKTVDLDPQRNYLFGLHPHGLLSFGGITCFGTEALKVKEVFPGIKPRVLGLAGWFRIPVIRELGLSSGSSCVSQRSIDNILSSGPGSSVVLPIGGAAEVLQSHPNTVSLILKTRKGFVRRALVNGAQLVPVFSFGENELYSQVPNPPGSLLRTIQESLKKVIGFYVPIAYGRGVLQYNLGYLPYRKPVNVVVGAPIEVPRNENPTAEQVDEYHAKYLLHLEQLFDEHKAKYGQADIKMNFV